MMRIRRSFLPTKRLFIRTSQGLFLLLALIWTALGLSSLLRPPSGMADGGLWLIVVLMAGNVVALLLGAWSIGRGGRWFYLFAIVVVAINLVLSVTDEFGLLGLISLLLDGILLLL